MKSRYLRLAVVGAVVGFVLQSNAAPIFLSAEHFAVMGASTVTSTGGSVLKGNLGVYPGSAIAGFLPGIVNGTTYVGEAMAQQAQADALAAFNAMAGESVTLNLTGQDLGGLTLSPGVLRFDTSAQLTGILILDAHNDSNARFDFLIGTTLTTAGSSSVLLINGASADNVFWHIGSSATLGAATEFLGSIIAYQSITLNTGASLLGRAFALNGAVTLANNLITVPPIAPAVNTLSASGITATTARLNGTVNPNGSATTVYFQYGLTTSYGSTSATNLLAATNAVLNVTNLLSGLAPGTIYHYRLVATNSEGTTLGSDQAFFSLLAPVSVVTLTGQARVTNECHSPYTDLGAFSGPSALGAGGYHSLALRSDGTVAAWGWNGYGQTDIPAGLSNVVAVAGGWSHSLALRSDGTVAAWGNNDQGQTTIPAGLSNVVAVAAGEFHSVALRSDGTVVAWGDNDSGQLNIPAGLSNVVALAGGGFHSLALRSDGTVVAWGRNSSGQTDIPAGLSNVVALAGGGSHSLALRSDGTVVAWGRNNLGQTTIPAGLSLPATVSGSVDSNTPGSYGLTYSATDSLGVSTSVTRTVVVRDTLPPVITRLGSNPLTHLLNTPFIDPGATALDACGGSLAILTNSTVDVTQSGFYTVSYLSTDASGNSRTATRTVLVAPLSLAVVTLNGQATVTNECHSPYTDAGAFSGASALAGGAWHSMALRSDGTVAAWGYDGDGQTTLPAGLSNMVALAGGDSHSLALLSDGTVAAWGNNDQGQTDIPAGLSNVVAVAGGDYHSLALRSDGTVAAWGDNFYGQTTIPAGLSNVVALAAGASHSLALRSDGTVAAWGDNSWV